MVVGGLKYRMQNFNPKSANISSALLFVSIAGMNLEYVDHRYSPYSIPGLVLFKWPILGGMGFKFMAYNVLRITLLVNGTLISFQQRAPICVHYI